jgi:transglutaminase-like putative cysteine protease
MYYSITHVTRFGYSAPISESVMEVRMRPRTEGLQRCLSFELSTSPRTRLMFYHDYLGNTIHHFDIPGQHRRQIITAKALVERQPSPRLPPALDATAWGDLDEMVATNDYWEMLLPSHFARPTERLHELARELKLERRDDPLTLLRRLNTALYEAIKYVPKSTRVDSPIDDALRARQGVCQDYTHIMIALVRRLGIPCRYVSGYLFHRVEDHTSEDATHAWVEALLPGLGWVGFDPSNNVLTGDRHIQVAIGRDYADVPPTRGVFKGHADGELAVAVKVSPADASVIEADLESVMNRLPPDVVYQQQQQQQQQQ